jgi:hypothetical protein
VVIKNIFWDIAPCSPLKFNRRFGGTYRLHLQSRRIIRSRYQRESDNEPLTAVRDIILPSYTEMRTWVQGSVGTTRSIALPSGTLLTLSSRDAMCLYQSYSCVLVCTRVTELRQQKALISVRKYKYLTLTPRMKNVRVHFNAVCRKQLLNQFKMIQRVIYLHLTIAKFLDSVHRSVFRIEHNVSESGSVKW